MISIKRLAVVVFLEVALSTAAQAEGTFFKPAKQVLPPAETKEPPTDAAPPSQGYPDVLSGAPVVLDPATLVVDGHRVMLAGLDGLTGQFARGLKTFIDSDGGTVTCTLID